jgi:origin recognition complex subunit 5
MDVEVEDKGTVHLNDDFFQSFSEVIYSIFFQNCKDLNELRHLVALLFPLFINPIRDGRGTSVLKWATPDEPCLTVIAAKPHETAKLFKLSQPYFAEATDKLYLREISSSEWAKRTSEMADAKTTPSHTVDASVIAAIRTNAKGR